MKTWPFAVVGLICLALAGCRTDPNIVLLERENRLQEDEIYRLRAVIQDYEEGGTPINTPASVKADVSSETETGNDSETAAGPGKLLAPRSRKTPSRQSVQPPVVEMPGEAQPPGEIPDTLKRPAGTRAPGEPGKLQPSESPKQWREPTGPNLPVPQGINRKGTLKTSQVHPTSGFEPVVQDDSRDVGQVVINRMLTGAFSAQGKSGDDGVLVVLEPRDSKGRRLEAPGEVAVVLLDPAKTGDQARVARWDFPASETAKLFRGSGIARGMYIECPWPDNPPQNNRLHLFVRYTTRDGRKLQVDQPIEIAPPGEKTARWTPAEPAQQEAYASETETASYQADRENAAAESEAGESYADDSPPPRSARSMRAASRSNTGRSHRPVWSPERF
jgi:hypothetical protein